MKTLKFISAIVAFAFFSACNPDLTVESLECSWNSSTDGVKTVDITIKNIGNKEATSFLVYINPDEDPVSGNHRPQFSSEIESLAPNASFTIELGTEDFINKMHVDNDSLMRVYQITILVDPKGMVKESNETNNEKVCNFE